MPASALAETNQVRQNCPTLAANELAFPALEQMRERYQSLRLERKTNHIKRLIK